jgi:hypothetical protein
LTAPKKRATTDDTDSTDKKEVLPQHLWVFLTRAKPVQKMVSVHFSPEPRQMVPGKMN